jgi:hypothetical protein
MEFATSTVGVTSASILCSDGRVIPCTVATSGTSGKYTCPITDSKSCLKPTPVIDGTKCPLSISNPGGNCASGSGTNSWWIEYVPPTGTTGYNVALGSVLCADGRFQSCSDGYGKLNCAIKENACSNPVPVYDGAYCQFPGSTAIPQLALISDSYAESNDNVSMPVWGIALIIAGCVVVVIVLMITVAVIRKRRTTQEIV